MADRAGSILCKLAGDSELNYRKGYGVCKLRNYHFKLVFLRCR